MATQIRVIAQDDDRVVYLDVSEEQPLTANFQFKDIQSIDKNKGNHTYNFRLPSTPNNDLFFNQYFEVTQQGNFNPKLKAEATISKNTIDVFNGYLQLTNVICSDDVTHHYECVVFSSVSTLGQVLDGKFISEFDWSGLDHTLNLANVTSSFNQGLLSGDIVYSLYDYGASPMYGGDIDGSIINDADNPLNVRTLKPQIRVKKLLQEILNQSGFTYESTFIDTTMSDLYVDLNSGGNGNNGLVTNYYDALVYADGTQTFTLTNGFHTIINTDTTSSLATNIAGLYNTTNGIYSPPAALFDIVEMDCQVVIKGQSSGSGADAPGFETTFQIALVNETTGDVIAQGGIQSITQDFDGVGYTGLEQAYFTAQIIEDFNSSDTYKFVVNVLDTTDATATYTIEESWIKFRPLSGFYSSGSGILYNATQSFFITQNVAKIKAIDFVTSLAKKFNLVIIPDEQQPTHLYISTYKDWIEQGNEVDWTSKLDTSKDVQLNPTTDLQAKSLTFTDADSKDGIGIEFKNQYGKTYGTYNLENDNDFGKDKQEIKTIFQPTITSYIPNTAIRGCVCYEGEGEDINNPEGIRMSFYCGSVASDVSTESIFMTDGILTTTDIEVSSFPLFQNYNQQVFSTTTECLTFNGEISDSSFPSPYLNAFFVYWQRFIEETYSKDARILTGTFFLSALDIMSMNFNDLILVKNTWFRLNKISNYPLTGSGSCSVELVKVERVNMVDDALVQCTSAPAYTLVSGEVIFTNTDTGVVEATTQGCCEAFGYTYNSSRCWNITDNPNDPEEPNTYGQEKIGNNNQNMFGIVRGIQNTNSDFGEIIGVRNNIDKTSKNIRIKGSDNQVKPFVSNSSIQGNNNSLNPYSLNFDGLQVKVFSRQSFKSNSITGDYGITLGNGDTFISGGADSIYNEVGRSGSGHFVKHCWTTAEEQINIGQYGEFTIGTGGNTPFINQANNLFRLQYPSMIAFEINVVGHDRGSVATRNQAYSFRKFSGVINNTNNSANVSILNVTADSVKETSEFTSYAFAILPGNGSFQPVTGGNEYVNDGMFYFTIDTNGANKLNNVDWTIDFRYTLVGLQNITRTPGTIIFSPTDISGCLLWVDAADVSTITESSGDVSQWDDKSGNNHHLTQSTASYQPTYSLSNFDPYIEFDGLNKVLGNTDANLINVSDSTNTMFIVFKSDNTTTSSSGQALVSVNYRGRQYYGMNINSTTAGAGGTAFMNKSAQDYSCNNSTIASTTKQVVIGTRDGTDRIIYDQNGNTDTKTNSSDTSQDMFSVGAAWETGRTPTADFRGKIYEIIVYDSVLSDAKRNQVLNYLQTKWNT